MQNKVGSVIPAEKEVTKVISHLRAASDESAEYTINLTPEERIHLLRFRPGGEPIIALLADLVEKHGVVLPGIAVDDMTADLTLAQRLHPIETEALTFTQRVQDTRLEALSEAWTAATAYYSVLTRMAFADPSLRTALQPAIDFFSKSARKRRAAQAPTEPSGNGGAATK